MVVKVKWQFVLLGLKFFLSSWAAQGVVTCAHFYGYGLTPYNVVENETLAKVLLTKKPLKRRGGNDDPPAIPHADFVNGLGLLKHRVFDSVDHFVSWKSRSWRVQTSTGTQGYKALKIAVAVLMPDKSVELVKIHLLDYKGDLNAHSPLIVLAAEAFGATNDPLVLPFKVEKHNLVILSKFSGQRYFEHMVSDSIEVRIAAEDMDSSKPIPRNWGREVHRTGL